MKIVYVKLNSLSVPRRFSSVTETFNSGFEFDFQRKKVRELYGKICIETRDIWPRLIRRNLLQRSCRAMQLIGTRNLRAARKFDLNPRGPRILFSRDG